METILEMTAIDWLIFVFAIAPYSPLIVGLIKQDDDSQTFFTWFLYLILDCITMFSGIKQDNHSYALLLGFAVGSLIMSCILLYQGRTQLKLAETMTVGLILICICVWRGGDSYWAQRAGIISECIVGIYLARKTFKNPVVEYNMIGYIGFLFVSIISMTTSIISMGWSVKEAGYATCEVILTIITLLPLFKKWWSEKQLKTV